MHRRVRSALAVAAMVASVTFVRAVAVEPVRIASDSMAPRLERGEYVVVAKWGDAPRRDDLIAFHSPEDGALTLKRVVAVAGQRVELRDGRLFVDGRVVSEPEIDASAVDATYFGPVTVGRDHVFVMGDNRADSVDSRHYGGIPLDKVVGHVLF